MGICSIINKGDTASVPHEAYRLETEIDIKQRITLIIYNHICDTNYIEKIKDVWSLFHRKTLFRPKEQRKASLRNWPLKSPKSWNVSGDP